jgi:hypothetical protein
VKVNDGAFKDFIGRAGGVARETPGENHGEYFGRGLQLMDPPGGPGRREKQRLSEKSGLIWPKR